MKNRSVFSKILLGLIAFGSLSSLRAQQEMAIVEASIEPEYAPPALSMGQVSELKNNFVFWLGKHYRCLYGGKCTRVEKEQVLSEWKRWIKGLGIGVVIALVTYFGRPMMKEQARAAKSEIIAFGKKFVEEVGPVAVAQLKDALALVTKRVDKFIYRQRRQLLVDIDAQRRLILGKGGDVDTILKKFDEGTTKIRSETITKMKGAIQDLIQTEGAAVEQATIENLIETILNNAIKRVKSLKATVPLVGEVRIVEVKPVSKESKEEKLEAASSEQLQIPQKEQSTSMEEVD